MRSNQSRITSAHIKYLSLPKRKGFDIIEVNLVVTHVDVLVNMLNTDTDTDTE